MISSDSTSECKDCARTIFSVIAKCLEQNTKSKYNEEKLL